MTEAPENFAERLKTRFEGLVDSSIAAHGQITLELPPENLLGVCAALRDEDEFAFAQLSDLCGVDYAAYGQADWETQDATSTGFSRGVSASELHTQEAGARHLAVVITCCPSGITAVCACAAGCITIHRVSVP